MHTTRADPFSSFAGEGVGRRPADGVRSAGPGLAGLRKLSQHLGAGGFLLSTPHPSTSSTPSPLARRRTHARIVGTWLARLAVAIVVCASPPAARAYDDRGPSPDMVAWEAFVEAVAPSKAPDGALEFETWASNDDLFGSSPPRWPADGSLSREPCKQTFDPEAAKAGGFPGDGCIKEEVRRNWAAFHYFASNGLASKAGLARAFERGVAIDLPADSIQVKADWVKIEDLARWLTLSESDIRRSYATRTEDGGGTYALVGLHLNSKRWKNWLWATFEHRMNPGRCDDIGCHDAFGAALPDVLPREAANENYGPCAKTTSLIAMLADAGLSPVWLNYCLKGVQVSFKTKDGAPVRLGNSVVDRINGHFPMAHSSCMSCHALAGFDRNGEAAAAPADDPVGDVDKTRLRDYVTSGFVWGVARAK